MNEWPKAFTAEFIELETNLLDLEAQLQMMSCESRTPIG